MKTYLGFILILSISYGCVEKEINENTSYSKIEPYIDQALDYEIEENYDSAFVKYTEAIDAYPNYCESYFARGIFFFRRRKNEEALNDFNKSIELCPSEADNYYFRADCYRVKKEYNLAIKDLEKAIKLDPEYCKEQNCQRRIDWIKKKGIMGNVPNEQVDEEE